PLRHARPTSFRDVRRWCTARMTHRRNGHAPTPPSRHARDLQTLRQAAHTAAPPRAAAVAAAAALPAVSPAATPRYSFNWQAGPEEPLLVPRCLQAADLP